MGLRGLILGPVSWPLGSPHFLCVTSEEVTVRARPGPGTQASPFLFCGERPRVLVWSAMAAQLSCRPGRALATGGRHEAAAFSVVEGSAG